MKLTPAEIQGNLEPEERVMYERLVAERQADPSLRMKGWSRRIRNLEHRAQKRLQTHVRRSQPPLPLEP